MAMVMAAKNFQSIRIIFSICCPCGSAIGSSKNIYKFKLFKAKKYKITDSMHVRSMVIQWRQLKECI